MHTITLSGYYGYGNAGDEAVLAGLVTALRAHRTEGELKIVALSGRPDETAAAHEIAAADRYKAPALIRALARTDALLSGGGSLLQDVTSAHSVFYYLGVVRLAQMLGKKTMFVAQGIGPLIRPRTRRLVAGVANRLDAITVRDDGSAALLRQIGVTRPPMEVTAERALLLTPPRTVVLDGGPWAAVALRPWGGRDAALAETVAHACHAALPRARMMAVPMQPQMDAAIGEHFARLRHQEGDGEVVGVRLARPDSRLVPLEPLLENLAACHMVIGMRLHALILAAACAVPAVALSYDPKVTAFMARSGQSDAVYDLQSDDAEALTALLRRTWAERATRADALRERLPSLRASAQRNADLALELLT